MTLFYDALILQLFAVHVWVEIKFIILFNLTISSCLYKIVLHYCNIVKLIKLVVRRSAVSLNVM